MRLIRKLFIATAVVVGLLVILVAVAVLILPESDMMRDTLRDRLSAATGQDVSVGELKVSISFPDLLHLNLQRISVKSKDGMDLLSVERAVLSPSLWSLLKRRVDVESVNVQGLRATARRDRNGVFSDFMLPAPGASPAEAPPSEPHPEGKPPVQAAPVQWSVNLVRLSNARIDWIDEALVPGRTVSLSLQDLNGTMKRQPSEGSVAVEASGKLGNGSDKRSPLKLDAVLTPTPDQTALKTAQGSLRVDDLTVRFLTSFLPPDLQPLEVFDKVGLTFRVQYAQTKPLQLSVDTALQTTDPGLGRLTLQGDLTTTADLTRMATARGTIQAEKLAFKTFRSYVPRSVPLNPEAGAFTANLQGEWSSDTHWKLGGAVHLDDAVPTEALKGIARKLHVAFEGELNPQLLLIKGLEISESARLASCRGRISSPFSGAPEVDLTAELALDPRWLPMLGARLPEGVTLQGVVPVTGRATGRILSPAVQITGDLSGSDVSWTPFLRKPRGQKAGFTVQTDSLSAVRLLAGARTEASFRVDLHGVDIRSKPNAAGLNGAALHGSGKLVHRNKGVDLIQTSLTVKRGAGATELLAVRGDLLGLPARSAKLEATIQGTIDKTMLAALGVTIGPELTLDGSAAVSAKLSGSPSALTWTLSAPLDRLELAVRNDFRKPAGMKGELKAAGKWNEGELTLSEGNLRLAGLSVTGRGLLTDKHGQFHDVSLDLKRADSATIAALVPNLGGKGLSGPVEAEVRLKPAAKGVSASGTVRLLGVDIRPQGAAVTFEKLKGTVVSDGVTLEIPELVGTARGMIEAPFKANGKVEQINSPEAMHGLLSFQAGEGRLHAERFQSVFNQVHTLVGTLLNPKPGEAKGEPLRFQTLTGDVQLKSGRLTSENLKLRGQDLAVGAIGSLVLASQELDLIAGIHTITIVPGALARIPQVREAVDKHKDFLKRIGVDKELKRFGIDVDAAKSEGGEPAGPARALVTVLIQVRGAASSPKVTPVLETTLDKATVSQLKALLN